MGYAPGIYMIYIFQSKLTEIILLIMIDLHNVYNHFIPII